MNKKVLKDGLKETIKMKLCRGLVIEFDSLNELMLGWYENYRDKIKHENPTYRGIKLNIIYNEVLDDKKEVIKETDFITIRKDLEKQISKINEMRDGLC